MRCATIGLRKRLARSLIGGLPFPCPPTPLNGVPILGANDKGRDMEKHALMLEGGGLLNGIVGASAEPG